jgi:hypothetical protein
MNPRTKFVKQLLDSYHRPINDLTWGDLNNQGKINDPAIKENKMSETELLTKVVTAITYLYKSDVMSPNVIISALPNKKIYLSINRYNYPNDRFKKRIIFTSTKKDTNEVLMDAVKWLITQKKQSKNPIDELQELIEQETISSFVDSDFEL